MAELQREKEKDLEFDRVLLASIVSNPRDGSRIRRKDNINVVSTSLYDGLNICFNFNFSPLQLGG